MTTGEMLMTKELRNLIKATWSLLRDNARRGLLTEIEYFYFDERTETWSYMGLGQNETGLCTITGRFTRSIENYCNDHSNIAYMAGFTF